jgi:hypothetical protein
MMLQAPNQRFMNQGAAQQIRAPASEECTPNSRDPNGPDRAAALQSRCAWVDLVTAGDRSGRRVRFLSDRTVTFGPGAPNAPGNSIARAYYARTDTYACARSRNFVQSPLRRCSNNLACSSAWAHAAGIPSVHLILPGRRLMWAPHCTSKLIPKSDSMIMITSRSNGQTTKACFTNQCLKLQHAAHMI